MKERQSTDRKYLQRCIVLASRGNGFVSPDPMVGCSIVKNGRILAEGFHRVFGGQHAEIEALRKAGRRAKGATMYVNLEPCSHQGKTSPCVDAIIAAGIARVVTCSPDPNPLASGRGTRRLRKAGIVVRTGILRDASKRLNERFFTFMQTGLPFVALKTSQSLDGRVAGSSGRSKLTDSRASRLELHRLRSMYDAVLVGVTTVVLDDPRLTVRHAKGRNPLRVVLDPGLRASSKSAVFDTRHAGTLIFATARAMSRRKSMLYRMSTRGVYILGLDEGNPFDLSVILKTLAALGVSSILVEGGSYTASEFLRQGRVDKIHAFVVPRILGNGVGSIAVQPSSGLESPLNLNDVTCRQVGPDFLIEGYVAR